MRGKITVGAIGKAKTAEPAAALGKNEGAPTKRPAAATRGRPARFDGDADAEGAEEEEEGEEEEEEEEGEADEDEDEHGKDGEEGGGEGGEEELGGDKDF
eukprot:8976296-Pyramimonas_sp.AAC.1